jgi:DNA polymerase kappa
VRERWLLALGIHKVSDIWLKRGTLALMKHEMGLDFLLKAYLGLGRSKVEAARREDRRSIGGSSLLVIRPIC